MYAIIDVGGKQFKVEKGKTFKVSLPKHTKLGDKVEFKLIMVSGDDKKIQVAPKGKMIGKVTGFFKDKKIVVFKKRPKKTYKKTIGHRQNYAHVEVSSIGE